MDRLFHNFITKLHDKLNHQAFIRDGNPERWLTITV